MKITHIQLIDFKRFKSLEITDLPDTAKLVMLIGPNGCGKSSLFDGIYAYARHHYYGMQFLEYYARSKDLDINSIFRVSKITFGNAIQSTPEGWKKAVYVRTAYRNTPSFSIGNLSKVGSVLTERGVVRMIENDSTTAANYQRLISNALEDAFENQSGENTLNQFRESILGEIRDMVAQLFPNLILNSLGNPLGGNTTFRFDKGEVGGFNYENLSGGEKAAFELILDLVVKRKEYNDTVFCIDEPEVHINPKLQGKLLRALYNLVPDNCQLWLATHSIGMMREAYNMQKDNPEKVVFLDFGGRNFDQPQTIRPEKMTRALWEKIHEIVLGDLADLVAPDILCICESTPERKFDAECYGQIFAEEYPVAKFVSVGSKSDVKNMLPLLSETMPKLKVIAIRDGDHMTEAGKAEARKAGVSVLSRKCIESYLLDDEVLKAFCDKYFTSDESMLREMVEKRDGEDIKGAPYAIRAHAIKKNKALLIGDNGQEFMKHTLSPLIKPGMQVYAELKQDIFVGMDTGIAKPAYK